MGYILNGATKYYCAHTIGHMSAARLILAASAVIAVVLGISVVNEVRISGGAEVGSAGACLDMQAGQDIFVQFYLTNATNGRIRADSIELGRDGMFAPADSWWHNTHGEGGIFTGDFPFEGKLQQRAEPLVSVDFAPGQDERVLVHVALPEGESGVHYSEVRLTFHNSYGVAGSTVTPADFGLVLDTLSDEEKSTYCPGFYDAT